MSLLHTKQCLQLLVPIFNRENVWCRPALKKWVLLNSWAGQTAQVAQSYGAQ
jgi:hypothetical protein